MLGWLFHLELLETVVSLLCHCACWFKRNNPFQKICSTWAGCQQECTDNFKSVTEKKKCYAAPAKCSLKTTKRCDFLVTLPLCVYCVFRTFSQFTPFLPYAWQIISHSPTFKKSLAHHRHFACTTLWHPQFTYIFDLVRIRRLIGAVYHLTRVRYLIAARWFMCMCCQVLRPFTKRNALELSTLCKMTKYQTLHR